jgi:hypothetical protein
MNNTFRRHYYFSDHRSETGVSLFSLRKISGILRSCSVIHPMPRTTTPSPRPVSSNFRLDKVTVSFVRIVEFFALVLSTQPRTFPTESTSSEDDWKLSVRRMEVTRRQQYKLAKTHVSLLWECILATMLLFAGYWTEVPSLYLILD